MRSYEEAVQLILFESGEIPRLKKARKAIETSGAADKVDKIDDLDGQIELHKRKRINVLTDLVAYPPRFMEYAPLIEKYRQSVDKSIQPRATCTWPPDGRPGHRVTSARLRGITGS